MDRLFKSAERPFFVGLILLHTKQFFKVTNLTSDWLLSLAPVFTPNYFVPNYLVGKVECKSVEEPSIIREFKWQQFECSVSVVSHYL